MPPETCNAHGPLMEAIGEIKADVRHILDNQSTLYDKINVLAVKESQMDIEAAVDRTKAKPIYWGLAVLGGVVFSILAQILVKSMGWMK